jgi:hypothetical protein
MTHRSKTLEATNNGKTRSRGLGTGVRRGGDGQRAVRFFRDIHGAESDRHPNTVLVGNSVDTTSDDGDRHSTGDDDLLRRHWSVVCTDRRSAAQREVVR